MKRLLRFLLPLVVLLAGIAIASSLIATAPKTERKPPQVPIPAVEVKELRPQTYLVKVQSRGTVSPVTSRVATPPSAVG